MYELIDASDAFNFPITVCHVRISFFGHLCMRLAQQTRERIQNCRSKIEKRSITIKWNVEQRNNWINKQFICEIIYWWVILVLRWLHVERQLNRIKTQTLCSTWTCLVLLWLWPPHSTHTLYLHIGLDGFGIKLSHIIKLQFYNGLGVLRQFRMRLPRKRFFYFTFFVSSLFGDI